MTTTLCRTTDTITAGTRETSLWAEFSGPFTVRWEWLEGHPVERLDVTWERLQALLPLLRHIAETEHVGNIGVLDRHGRDVTFSADVFSHPSDSSVVTG